MALVNALAGRLQVTMSSMVREMDKYALRVKAAGVKSA